MSPQCQACETAAYDCIEPCDNAESPYRLCSDCHHRLHARTLRPREWYNLAKRHGWRQFLLHDDFYDEDGSASQPDGEVESPELHPAPTLKEVSSDPLLLFNFTVTRWWLEEPVADAWRCHPPEAVLPVISRQFAETLNIYVRAVALSVASIVGTPAERFVEYAWGEYPDGVKLRPLAKASASCLSQPEGIARVIAALATLSDQEVRLSVSCLSYFHSPAALAWIEANISSPVTEDWGRLAAASDLDWPRMVQWLERGRPLSLAALDALAAIIRPQTPFLRDYSPRLNGLPNTQTLELVLRRHAERDPAPRVKMTTNFILGNVNALIEGSRE
jgi:hypothetical protein